MNHSHSFSLYFALLSLALVATTAQHGGHGGGNHTMHGNSTSSGNGTAICPTGVRLDLDERYSNEMHARMASESCNCTGTLGMDVHNHGGNEYMVGHPHYCCGPYITFTNQADAERSAFSCGITGVHEHHPGIWMLGAVHGCGPLEFFGIDNDACSASVGGSPAMKATVELLAAGVAVLALSVAV